jgi:GT2 family glycosyltransferase
MQTLAPWQIIVVDNASRDASTRGIEERHPAVQAIRLTKNIGFAAANNLAVNLARECDWVALLNPDAFPDPSWLVALWQSAQTHPEYSFFGSRILCAGCPERLDGTGDNYHVSGVAWRQDHGATVSKRSLVVREIFSPCAAAALYRRDVFLEAGGFDENYFCYFEDIDLAFRLRLMRQRCLYVPEAVVRHVGWATTGEDSDFSVYHGYRNLMWTYVKDMPVPLFWLYLPQHLLVNVATLVWFSFRGRARIVFKAKWDGLCGLPRAWRQRREIQAERQVGARELRRLMSRGLFMPYRERK